MNKRDVEHRWLSYYEAVQGRPPRDTLRFALDRFEAETLNQSSSEVLPFAVDLGCGTGRDTLELLRRGWRVLAIDGKQEAIAGLIQQLSPASQPENPTNHPPQNDAPSPPIETQIQSFESLKLPKNVDLINASFCLPFCTADRFPGLWETIVASLRPGGRFSGQLIGERDSWKDFAHVLTQERAQVEAMLQPFFVEWFAEEEHPGKTAIGEDKHWHIFHIVAQKWGEPQARRAPT